MASEQSLISPSLYYCFGPFEQMSWHRVMTYITRTSVYKVSYWIRRQIIRANIETSSITQLSRHPCLVFMGEVSLCSVAHDDVQWVFDDAQWIIILINIWYLHSANWYCFQIMLSKCYYVANQENWINVYKRQVACIGTTLFYNYPTIHLIQLANSFDPLILIKSNVHMNGYKCPLMHMVRRSLVMWFPQRAVEYIKT